MINKDGKGKETEMQRLAQMATTQSRVLSSTIFAGRSLIGENKRIENRYGRGEYPRGRCFQLYVATLEVRYSLALYENTTCSLSTR